MAAADLSAVVVEDAHQADGHHLVDAAAQRLPVERKHEGHLLLAAGVDDGVERLIQASCRRRRAQRESQGGCHCSSVARQLFFNPTACFVFTPSTNVLSKSR